MVTKQVIGRSWWGLLEGDREVTSSRRAVLRRFLALGKELRESRMAAVWPGDGTVQGGSPM